jgi:MFS family permease
MVSVRRLDKSARQFREQRFWKRYWDSPIQTEFRESIQWRVCPCSEMAIGIYSCPHGLVSSTAKILYITSILLLKASHHLTSLLPTYRFAVGALTCGFISDTIGRKYTIMAGFIGSYVSVTMEVVANTNGLFFAGKFLNGFVVGMLAAVCPTYLGEIVPLALRGLLTAMIAFAYALSSTHCRSHR